MSLPRYIPYEQYGTLFLSPDPLDGTPPGPADDGTLVTAMFDAHPDMRKRVRAVLERYDASPVAGPRVIESRASYWRRVCGAYVAYDKEADERGEFVGSSYASDDPFYVVDLGRVVTQMARFHQHLPGVRPYYMVKCNDCEAMLSMFGALGGGFDCSSESEFNRVLDAGYGRAEDVLFGNACKVEAHMRRASERGVRKVTFDNLDEVEKLRKYMPSAEALLQLRAGECDEDTSPELRLGCVVGEARGLLQHARRHGVRVVGVSFHVGRRHGGASSYVEALRDARVVFDEARALGFEMHMLDVGGGFPGIDTGIGVKSFEGICGAMRPLLTELFPGVTVLAEPGCFFAATPFALVMNVHSKRVVPDGGRGHYLYYLNDGAYQSFNLNAPRRTPPEFHCLFPKPMPTVHKVTLFGPTCDALDCLLKQIDFPELELGDWVFVPDFGAYTLSVASRFNGFHTRRMVYLTSVISDVTSSNGDTVHGGTAHTPPLSQRILTWIRNRGDAARKQGPTRPYTS